jgi:hypothetical protein
MAETEVLLSRRLEVSTRSSKSLEALEANTVARLYIHTTQLEQASK